MKVRFPAKEEWIKIFERLPPVSKINVSDGVVEVDCPFGYEFTRDACRLSVREFARLFRSIEVEGGRKKKKWDKIILEPHKTVSVAVRWSPTEYEYVKKAAESAGMKVSEYIRSCVFMRMIRDLNIE